MIARLICWLVGHRWQRVATTVRDSRWVCQRCGQAGTTPTRPTGTPVWMFWRD